MKILLSIIGILFIISGGIWFLQGINLLPGSFMTGQPQWVVYGILAIIAGVVLMLIARRFARRPPTP